MTVTTALVIIAFVVGVYALDWWIQRAEKPRG